jgi:hypothetical protein
MTTTCADRTYEYAVDSHALIVCEANEDGDLILVIEPAAHEFARVFLEPVEEEAPKRYYYHCAACGIDDDGRNDRCLHLRAITRYYHDICDPPEYP